GYGRFATELLSERKLMAMPPFGHLALLRAESPDPRKASAFLQQVSLWLQPLAPTAQVEIWGPAPALMPKKARRFRYQLMLRADQRPALQALLKQLTRHLETTSGHQLRWSLDVDPVTLD